MSENEAVFSSAEAAAEQLAGYAKRFAFPCLDKDPLSIARESAEGAWLKALSRKRAGSAEVYRRWAEGNVPKMAKNARYVINQEQFDILVRRTGSDLLRAWRDAFPDGRSRICYGIAYRAVDLLFMAIDGSKKCRHDVVRRFLHIPLDGSTLKPLRLIIDELTDVDFALEIPAAIPPGFVATEEQYVLLQGAISNLARRAGIPPILYAYWCAKAEAGPSRLARA
jgi:hypothetical protein